MKELNLICPINFLGYGRVGTEVCIGLMREGIKVNLFQIGPGECSLEHKPIIDQAKLNAETYDKNANSLRIYHQFDLASHVGHGLHIGWPIFELDRFTLNETHQIKSMDGIIVCSQWARSIINPINGNNFVCPLGVDTEIFKPELSTRKNTIFLNMGKWEVRKGHDVLVSMFNDAFTESDNVELWMVNHNPFYSIEENNEWADRYKNSKLGGKIRIIPRLQSDYYVARLMQQTDCGVFPTKAEGWNLEPLEMFACGKDIISTDYSGHTEYLNDDNAMLVDIEEMESAYDGKWFFNQGNWAKIGVKQHDRFVHYMKEYHSANQFKKTLNTNGIKTANQFTWKNTITQLKGILGLD